jgi:PBP1b-binding outer membrane lipoprotein LpoB
MKKLILYTFTAAAIFAVSCKSKSDKVDSADSGQVHVGGSTATDSAKYPATPVETGGQDTSADGTSNTNPSKDTLKKNP